MVDDQRRVDMLAATGEKDAREIELAACARERDVDVVAGKRRTGGELEAAIAGVLADARRPSGQMRGAGTIDEALDVIARCAVGDRDIGDGVGEIARSPRIERDMCSITSAWRPFDMMTCGRRWRGLRTGARVHEQHRFGGGLSLRTLSITPSVMKAR